MSLDCDVNVQGVVWPPITSREELQELRDLLAETRRPNYWFNHFLNRVAGYETTLNSRGHQRRIPGASRWEALGHPITDLDTLIRLVKRVFPFAPITLWIPGEQETAKASLDENGGIRSWGTTPCLALALELVDKMLRAER